MSRQKRQNASDIVFPTLGTGDLVIYNFTLYHGVAPVEAGTRYSFVLFFDMDNPAIQIDFEDFEDDDAIDVSFYHDIEDVELSLVFVDTDVKGHPTDVIETQMRPFIVYPVRTYVGHVFRALIRGTDTVVSEFVMNDNESEYIIMEESPHTEL